MTIVIEIFNYILTNEGNSKQETMTKEPTRRYHRVGENKRVQLIALKEKGDTMKQISRQMKVNVNTVKSVLRKWKSHHTIKDLPKTGRPSKVDDRTRRRLTRMIQSEEVSTVRLLS